MRKAKGPMSVHSDIRRSANPFAKSKQPKLKPIQPDDPWLQRFDPESFSVADPPKGIDKEKH